MGIRGDRCGHDDRYGNFSEARGNGPRGTVRFGRVRGVDRWRGPVRVWRAFVC